MLFFCFCTTSCVCLVVCSTSHPGGNQVDGLPPASSERHVRCKQTSQKNDQQYSTIVWMQVRGNTRFFYFMLFGPGDCFCGLKMAFLNFAKFSIFCPKLAPSSGSFRHLKTIGLQKFWHQSLGNDLLSLGKIRILNLNYQSLSNLQNTRAHPQKCPSNQNLPTSPACFPNYSYRA